MDTPTIKNKWIEVYFGLFGPCLTYHTSGYNDDNARLVISLLICQIYFTLPWKHHTKKTNEYCNTYGFYAASEPARMLFIWGDCYKAVFMPWSKVIIERELLDVHNEPVFCGVFDEVVTYEDMMNEIKEIPSNYLNEAHGYGKDFRYFVAKIKTCPRIFRKRKWFSRTSYECYVDFEKDFNGYTNLVFNMTNNVCVDKQIELQLMMRDQFYMDF